MKRNVLTVFLAICLIATCFSGCDMSIFGGLVNPTESADQVIGPKIENAAGWDAAFENLELTKFTAETIRRDSNNAITSAVCYAYTDNGAFYSDESDEVYTVKNSDGAFTTYRHIWDTNVTLILNDTSDDYYDRIWDMSAVLVSFAGHFDKFTFHEENASYVSEELLEIPYKYPSGSEGVWYCHRATLSFIDGKVNAIAMDISTGNAAGFEYPVHTYRFYDIGTAVLELPQGIISAARPESMQPIYPVMQQNANPVQDAAAWDTAFDNLALTNYSATIIQRDPYGYSKARHCVLTEYGAYFYYSYFGDYYTEVDENGRYATYYRPFGDLSFTSVEDLAGSMWNQVKELMTYNISLKGNFDKFTYDAETGSYICEEVLGIALGSANANETKMVYTDKIIVQFVNGQIRTMITEFRSGTDETLPVNTISYFNIGTSNVKIPQEVIDEAQPMPQIPVAPDSAA